MQDFKSGKIGLISDSHSNNSLMLDAIRILNDNGASSLIHLGDFCDSLMPETVDDSVEILNKYNVKTLLGNNEYIILTEFIQNNPGRVKDSTVSFMEELPYNFALDDICFAHSLPYDWPAATRQPLKGLVYLFSKKDDLPYRIIFRGHSHTMSVVEVNNGQSEEILVKSGEKIQLLKDKKYIITVGAVEDGICAIFDPVSNEFCSIPLQG